MKLSYSQLATYKTCPKKYEFAYIQKIPPFANSAASFGSSLHNTLQKFYERIQEQNDSPSLFDDHAPDTSLEALLDIYHSCWISRGFKTLEEEQLKQDEGEKILKEFYAKHEHDFGTPYIIEKGFKLHIDGVIISGRFDRIDETGMQDGKKTVNIIDYKSGRIRSQEDVDKDLQLSIYHLAAEECLHVTVDKVSLYFLKDNTEVVTVKSEQDLKEAREKIQSIANGIKKQDFEAIPSPEKCKCCDYKNMCPYSAA